MAVSTAFVAASTNRFSHAADASPSSLIALGSGNLVALWDVTASNDLGIFQTLPGHEAVLTCVRFLPDERMVTGDEQGFLFLWKKEGGKFQVKTKVKAHDKPITALCALDDHIISGSSDSTVKIWEIDVTGHTDRLEQKQTISTQTRYPLDLALTLLPGTRALLLAISGTDTKVQLYLRSEGQFIYSTSLAGHEDWVRALSFRPSQTSDEPLILASGSQDATIRLWNIEPVKSAPELTTGEGEQGLGDELLDAFEASLGEVAEGEEGGRQISLKRHILTVKASNGSSQQFSVTFDALLVGHEAGITSLSWRPNLGPTSVPTILSSSTDSSLILWSPSTILAPTEDGSTSIWINRQRFGDIGGQRLGGFVGSLWARNGQEALAWGWAGGWRRWSCTNAGKMGVEEEWQELGAVSGHKGAVKGLAWSPKGEYLISAGIDQTTRIYGELFRSDGTRRSWHEIARPQVHGYDLLDAVFLDPLKFISIADEKVARVFEAPRNFVQLVEELDVAHFPGAEEHRPAGASVPPLGLSNKAVGAESSLVSVLAPPTRRPFEGELSGSTLWPEIEKIFGHGYESMTLAVCHSRELIATACKATAPEHAVIRVYETGTFKLIGQPLAGHTLTVTRVAFSPDDRYILSVSRDRTWHLFEAKDGQSYVPIAADRAHARIIWDCAWAAEGDIFATASRDKTVKIWAKTGTSWGAVATIKMTFPATAVDFSPVKFNRRKLAVGLEDGSILVYNNTYSEPGIWTLDTTIDTSSAHVNQIHRLSWRPTADDGSTKEIASCSEDGTLKVLIIQGQ